MSIMTLLLVNGLSDGGGGGGGDGRSGGAWYKMYWHP